MCGNEPMGSGIAQSILSNVWAEYNREVELARIAKFTEDLKSGKVWIWGGMAHA